MWWIGLAFVAVAAASDPTCKYNGQFLADPSDECSFFRCDYGKEPWYDRYGNIQYVAVRQRCAPGTAVNPHKFNYDSPCSELSKYCEQAYQAKHPQKYGDDYKGPSYGYDSPKDGYAPAPKVSYAPSAKVHYASPPKASYDAPAPKSSYNPKPKHSYDPPAPKASYDPTPKKVYDDYDSKQGYAGYNDGHGHVDGYRGYGPYPHVPYGHHNRYDNVDGHETRGAYNHGSYGYSGPGRSYGYAPAAYPAPGAYPAYGRGYNRYDNVDGYQTRTAYPANYGRDYRPAHRDGYYY